MTYRLTDPAFLANPAPMLTNMRAEAAVVQIKLPIIGKTWMTTTDAAAREALKNEDLFVRDMATVGGKPIGKVYWWLPPFLKPLLTNMIGTDGERHKTLRGSVDRAFARVEIEDMRSSIAHMADALLDQISGPTTDLLPGYARPLPLMAICELLGVRSEDRLRVSRWIAPISGPTSRWTVLRAMPGLWRLNRYFREDFDLIRREGRPGLMGDLIATGTLSDEDMLSTVLMLFLAGHETTVHLIAMTVRQLLARPETMQQVKDDPRALPMLIEEVMRHDAPVMMSKPLFVTRDTVLHGVPLKKGDRLAALLIAANHDPDRFDNAETFDATRRPNSHLGWGHGPHVCLGMQLARAEAEVAIRRLITRFPDMARLDDDEFTRRLGIHGLTRLNVSLGPAHDGTVRNNI